jgi:hypothetical protein
MNRLIRFGLTAAALCGALMAGGCGDSTHLRGGEGESCVSRNDCERDLRCFDNVCVAEDEADDAKSDAGPKSGGGNGGTGGDEDAGGAPPPPALGREGDPCNAGSECERSFACLGNVCSVEGGASGTRYGARGETCRAKNDCSGELACLNNVCVEATIPLSISPKECHRVECEADEECCKGFEPDENCEAFKANCEMDPIFCNTYRSLCECNQKCEAFMCIAAPPGCGDDVECDSTQTPFCVDGACAQCASDANCPGEGARCIEGACTSACERDEQCALLQECVDGRCEDVGCKSHRECVFLLGQVRAECLDGECLVPCDADIECASSNMPRGFQVCDEGRCVFVGCETDAECRAYLGIAATNNEVRAVCK